MKEQIGPRALLARLKRNLGPYSEEIPELPLLAYRILQGLERQTLPLRWRSEELEQLRREHREHNFRLRALITAIGLVIGGSLTLVVGTSISPAVFPLAHILAIGSFFLGIIILLKAHRY